MSGRQASMWWAAPALLPAGHCGQALGTYLPGQGLVACSGPQPVLVLHSCMSVRPADASQGRAPHNDKDTVLPAQAPPSRISGCPLRYNVSL